MSALLERTVDVGGQPCRVREKGSGTPLGYIGGFPAMLQWTPFLDRLAESRHVIACSLPGFPGSGTGHLQLDTPTDWTVATLDLLEGAGLDGADLIGASVGGLLAAEVAAVSRASIERLVLIAPFGIFDESEPTADLFAQSPADGLSVLSARPEALRALLARPEGEDEIEWQVRQVRAMEAAARLLWPNGDTGLAKRLHRITHPSLLLWGSDDRAVPASYAKRFADGIAGPTTVRTIADAGHVLEVDAPDATAAAILEFLA